MIRLWRAKYRVFRGNETVPAGSLIMYDDETSSRRVFSSEEECDLYLAAAMGKKLRLTVRDGAVSKVWRLEDIG